MSNVIFDMAGKDDISELVRLRIAYVNEKSDHYNRKIKTDTFKELWKTDGHNHNVAIRVVRKR